MSTKVWLICAGLWALAFVFCACHEDKDIGLPEIFPQNATKLYFGDCDPFTADQEATDLVFDAADACTIPISFDWYNAGSWYSNTFRAQPGTYYEGCHLVFSRDQADVGQAAVFRVTFTGLAVQFNERVEIPVGQTSVTTDLFEQGTVSFPADSMVKIFVQISDSMGRGRLNTNYGNGSYVMTGADQGTVCRFEINLGLAQGIGHPNQGVVFSYENTINEPLAAIAWDFTGGASITDGSVFVFGPRYGVAYLTAESGGCHDTASFWAPPGVGFRDEELARFTASEDYYRNYLSNGITVWYWDVFTDVVDTVTSQYVRVLYLTHLPLIQHPINGSGYSSFSVFFDDANDLIWIGQNSSSAVDSAWGYTTEGILDSVVSFENITAEGVYLGHWLRTTSTDVFFRRAELTPLAGGTAVPIGPFPIELTRQFAGGAGVSYPGVAGSDSWTINVFDSLGNWIARQSVPVTGQEHTTGATILSAGSRVIYLAYSTQALYVRALQPE